MSDVEIQKLKDLYQMGFILIDEYESRMRDLGVPVESLSSSSSSSPSAAPAFKSTRLSLSSSMTFDGSMVPEAKPFHADSVQQFRPSTNVAHGSVAFQPVKCESEFCATSSCSRCGANVPNCCSADHEFVCFVPAHPTSETERPCPMSYLGCGARITSRTFTTHIANDCEHAKVKCRCLINFISSADARHHPLMERQKPLDGIAKHFCDFDADRAVLLKHIKTEHYLRMSKTGENLRSPQLHETTRCPVPGCEERLPASQMTNHIANCRHYDIVCHDVTTESNDVYDVHAPMPALRPPSKSGPTDTMSLEEFRKQFDDTSDGEDKYPNNNGYWHTNSCQRCVKRCDIPQVLSLSSQLSSLLVSTTNQLLQTPSSLHTNTQRTQHNVDVHTGRRAGQCNGLVDAHIAVRSGCGRRMGVHALASHLKRCRANVSTCNLCHADLPFAEHASHNCGGKRKEPLPFVAQLANLFAKK